MVAWSAAKLSSRERLSFITLISDEVKASRAMQELLRDVAYWHLADIKKTSRECPVCTENLIRIDWSL